MHLVFHCFGLALFLGEKKNYYLLWFFSTKIENLPILLTWSLTVLETKASDWSMNFDGSFEIAKTDECITCDFLRIGIPGEFFKLPHMVLRRRSTLFGVDWFNFILGSGGSGFTKQLYESTSLSISLKWRYALFNCADVLFIFRLIV